MPHKLNDDRCHKFAKAKYRVTNWLVYAPLSGQRGGQPIYSDLAIETGLALRLVLHLPLRQTEGAMRSIINLLGPSIKVPDHTTFSGRSAGLALLPQQRIGRDEPVHLLIDSTGLTGVTHERCR